MTSTSTRRRARRWLTLGVATVTGVSLLSGCAPQSDVVELDFFQFKPEAVGDFQTIIDDFEAENPDIRVRQNHVPAADTAIRTLLVKDKVPDVMTLNGNYTFGELAQAGIFHDFSDSPLVDTINPAVQQILQDLGSFEGEEVNGLAFANNGSSIIYNKDIFEQYGVEVPTTWDELLTAIQTFEDNDVLPFYLTLAEAWTIAPAFNNFGGALQPENFYDRMREAGENVGQGSEVSFTEDYEEAANKLYELFQHGQPNAGADNYNVGNTEFANGESAMYLQGTYAIPAIEAAGAEFEIGTFPYPTTDDPADTVLVSGVDVAVTMGRDTPHAEEAMRFIEYLMSPEVVSAYAEKQFAFSTLEGAPSSTAPELAGLVPYFDEERIIGYIDHQIPPAVPLQPTLQTYILEGDTDAFLTELDSEWRKVAARTFI